MPAADLLLENASQIVTFRWVGEEKPAAMGWQVLTLANGALAISDGKITAVGGQEVVRAKWLRRGRTQVVDVRGKTLLPGFVDSHTHPVFFNTREKEFEQRVQGKSYEEIAAAGGGIRSSIEGVRQASEEELLRRVSRRLDRFLELGTTTVEAKTGYGLSYEAEMKSLRVLNTLRKSHPIDVVPTFLGAHEMPDEYRNNRDDYIRVLTDVMIPEIAENHLAEFVDVYCEQGVYTPAETLKIASAAHLAGLGLKIHADQFHAIGCTELAAEMHAVSVDHLEQVTDAGVEKLRAFGCVATLLPGSVFFLGLNHYPPARKLMGSGVPVALATDFNPGSSMTQSLPLMMTLAALFMKMTPDEVLVAATIQGARALRREKRIGNLAEGYQADVLVVDAEDYRLVPYYFGVNLVEMVIKKGKILIDRRSKR